MPQGIKPKIAVVKPPKQEPMVKAPDNPEFASHGALMKEGMAAMAGNGNGDKPVDAPVPDPEDIKAPPVVEVKKEEKAPEEGPSAKGWALVKQQEKKIRDEREKFNEDRKVQLHELKQLREQLEMDRKRFQSEAGDIKASFKKDPFGTLKSTFGVTLNDLAQAALSDNGQVIQTNAGAPDPEKLALIERLDRMEKLMQGNAQRSEMEKYQAGIRTAIASEEYGLLQTMPNAEREIVELAGLHFKKTGELLQPDKAASIMLKFWEQHLEKVSSHQAARRILGLPDPTDGTTQTPVLGRKGPSKTITKKLASSPPPGQNPLPADWTEKQELEAAAKLVPDSAWDSMS